MRWLERVWLALENLLPSYCPDGSRRLPEDSFLVIGHRGSPARKPENTIASFEHAVAVEGANAVEIDLSLTQDGHVVVWHDWDPDAFVAQTRQRGWEPGVRYRPFAPPSGSPHRRRVSEITLAALREHYGYKGRLGIRRPGRKASIPTFREFVDWAAGRPGLAYAFLDIKLPKNELPLIPRLVEGIRQALAAHRIHFKAVLLTPDKDVFLALKAEAPELDPCLDTEVAAGAILSPEEYRAVPWSIAHGSSVACIGRPTLYTLVPWRTYCEIVRSDADSREHHNARNGRKRIEHLIGWTVNDARKMRCLIGLGITGILTDRPKKLRAITRRLRRRAPGGRAT